jgi:hypothetical protein
MSTEEIVLGGAATIWLLYFVILPVIVTGRRTDRDIEAMFDYRKDRS